jgi:hypothetical protein
MFKEFKKILVTHHPLLSPGKRAFSTDRVKDYYDAFCTKSVANTFRRDDPNTHPDSGWELGISFGLRKFTRDNNLYFNVVLCAHDHLMAVNELPFKQEWDDDGREGSTTVLNQNQEQGRITIQITAGGGGGHVQPEYTSYAAKHSKQFGTKFVAHKYGYAFLNLETNQFFVERVEAGHGHSNNNNNSTHGDQTYRGIIPTFPKGSNIFSMLDGAYGSTVLRIQGMIEEAMTKSGISNPSGGLKQFFGKIQGAVGASQDLHKSKSEMIKDLMELCDGLNHRAPSVSALNTELGRRYRAFIANFYAKYQQPSAPIVLYNQQPPPGVNDDLKVLFYMVHFLRLFDLYGNIDVA